MAVAWFLIALGIFALWFAGSWLIAIGLTAASLFLFGGVWQFQAFAIAVVFAPIVVRRLFVPRPPNDQGWGVEVRAFKALSGLSKRF